MSLKRSAPIAAAGAIVLASVAPAVQAAIIDPQDDFLPTYEGPLAGDLDVVSVGGLITGPGEVRLTGEHAGPIGATEDSAYVWGIDRGQGTELLTTLPDPVGEGVTFDAVAILQPDGTGSVIDLLTFVTTPLDPSAVGIAGDTITVVLTQALLPSTGFDFADYRYNLWPRHAPGGVDPANNRQISDFAPDAGTFVAAIPLPAALGLQLAGVAVLGAMGARRAARPA